jgi:hypothetical protein
MWWHNRLGEHVEHIGRGRQLVVEHVDHHEHDGIRRLDRNPR